MRYEIKLFFIFLFSILISQEVKAQEYFPPLTGKQWDTIIVSHLY